MAVLLAGVLFCRVPRAYSNTKAHIMTADGKQLTTECSREWISGYGTKGWSSRKTEHWNTTSGNHTEPVQLQVREENLILQEEGPREMDTSGIIASEIERPVSMMWRDVGVGNLASKWARSRRENQHDKSHEYIPTTSTATCMRPRHHAASLYPTRLLAPWSVGFPGTLFAFSSCLAWFRCSRRYVNIIVGILQWRTGAVLFVLDHFFCCHWGHRTRQWDLEFEARLRRWHTSTSMNVS